MKERIANRQFQITRVYVDLSIGELTVQGPDRSFADGVTFEKLAPLVQRGHRTPGAGVEAQRICFADVFFPLKRVHRRTAHGQIDIIAEQLLRLLREKRVQPSAVD